MNSIFLKGWTGARAGDVPPLHRLRLHAPHLGQIQPSLDTDIPPNDRFQWHWSNAPETFAILATLFSPISWTESDR